MQDRRASRWRPVAERRGSTKAAETRQDEGQRPHQHQAAGHAEHARQGGRDEGHADYEQSREIRPMGSPPGCEPASAGGHRPPPVAESAARARAGRGRLAAAPGRPPGGVRVGEPCRGQAWLSDRLAEVCGHAGSPSGVGASGGPARPSPVARGAASPRRRDRGQHQRQRRSSRPPSAAHQPEPAPLTTRDAGRALATSPRCRLVGRTGGDRLHGAEQALVVLGASAPRPSLP